MLHRNSSCFYAGVMEDGCDDKQFDIDWQVQTVTCPEGKQTGSWKPRTQKSGRTYIQIRFSQRDCCMCDAKALCTKGPQRA